MHDQPFVVMDFPGELAVVGYEFLQRFVVRIDYDHDRITMYDPARFNYCGGGVTVPMLVKSRGLLYVKGSVDGLKGNLHWIRGMRSDSNSSRVLCESTR